MKKIVLFLMLLISVSAFACKCNVKSFGENFAQNDFVAEIEIIETYDITSEINESKRLYKADIKILKLYKGIAISSILIKGKVGQAYGQSCEANIKKGEKLLVYLDSENTYQVSRCTPKKYLSDKKINPERKALEFLISEKINDTDVFYYSKNYFKNFKNLNPKNEFAVYKLKVNSKSKVESVTVIKNFGTEKDAGILKIIKNKFTILRDFMSEVKNEEVTLVLFHDKEKDEVISSLN